MEKFRFVTPSRAGKWYGDLKLAQQTANAIGAGFLDCWSGQFVAYPGTILETADRPEQPEMDGRRRPNV